MESISCVRIEDQEKGGVVVSCVVPEGLLRARWIWAAQLVVGWVWGAPYGRTAGNSCLLPISHWGRQSPYMPLGYLSILQAWNDTTTALSLVMYQYSCFHTRAPEKSREKLGPDVLRSFLSPYGEHRERLSESNALTPTGQLLERSVLSGHCRVPRLVHFLEMF